MNNLFHDPTENMNSEVNILSYFRIIRRKWKLLVSILIIAEVATIIIVVKTPPIYKSTATIIPPETIIDKGNLTTGNSPGDLSKVLLYNMYDIGISTDVVMAMLKSRKMAEDAAREFNFGNIYGSENITITASKIRSSTTISIANEKVILITVKSDNPGFSASIANFYVSNLDSMNAELNITSVKPIVTVLDSAVPARNPSSPKIKFSLLITGVVSLFMGILLSFFVSYIEELRMRNV